MEEQAFGDWLQERIREFGTNARQLALAIEVNPASISKWISGQRVPSMESCYDLADALMLDIDEVLARAGHRDRRPSEGESGRAEIHQLVDQIPDESVEAIRRYLRFQLAESRTAPVARAVRARGERAGKVLGEPRREGT